ncbi:MAG: methyltransferase domain-containing protein [Candidatus Dadabacteria bacterium]|nr:MAG: methyltransferase domain-containing protein [Candidatus Dadabacteria bacterium]
MPCLVLKPGREKSLLRRHPWIFSGAVAEVEGDPAAGDTVGVRAATGDLLARGAYSPRSQIRARLWTFDPKEAVDRAFFRRRLHAAIDLRRQLVSLRSTSAVRLVHGESDGLPGVIADRYGETLVLQCLTAGAERWRDVLADLLVELTGAEELYERSDAEVRCLEGLQPRAGPLRGCPRRWAEIVEHGLRYRVDIARGHKTGFYLDQRASRLLARRLAEGREVLDAFCYTGGFTLNALVGGAKGVVAIEASADALALARENLELNGLAAERVEFVEGDVFRVLRRLRDAARCFDMVVLDPPKFAPTSAHAHKAARGYKDINLLALKLLRPGGLLLTFSCSGGVDAALFEKIVASAALDAGVEAQVLVRTSQAEDHPASLFFPEGTYLKGLLVARR